MAEESNSTVTLVHHIGITFNKETGKYEGIPEGVRTAILNAGFTEDQVQADPSLVKDLLYSLSMEEVLSNAVPISISGPTNCDHWVSIRMNKETGKLEGVPEVIRQAIAKAGLTEEEVMANPDLAKKILYEVPLAAVVKAGKEDPNISLPKSVTHHVSIRFNAETGKFEGVPPAVRQALEEAGLSDQQVLDNPDLAKDILYKLNLDEVLAGLTAPDQYISAPKEVNHYLRITFNRETGKFEGIPDEVREAFTKAGITEEQVMANPSLAKDILYQLSMEDVFKGASVQ